MRVLFVLVCFLLAAAPAAAQEMPTWAAPQELPDREQIESPEQPSPERAPDLPDDPAPVPLDAGLAVLALAGAGLAARRLKST